MSTTAATVSPSPELAWQLVFKSDYLSITEQFRLRQISTKFNSHLLAQLKDAEGKKYVCKELEARALVKLGCLPSKLSVIGPELTIKSLLPLLSSGHVQALSTRGCPFEKMGDNFLVTLGNHSAAKLVELEVDCRAIHLGSRNGYNGSRQNTFTDAGFKPIAQQCVSLHTLTLVWVRSFSEEGLKDLITRCTALDRVKLWWCNCTERVMLALSLRENLLELDLRTCKETPIAATPTPTATPAPPAEAPPAAAAAAVAASNVKEEVGLKQVFSRCTKLNRLALVDVESCTDDALVQLASGQIKQLAHLFLSDLSVTNAGLEALCVNIAPGLLSLHLSHLKSISNATLAKLVSACEALQRLELAWIPGITDDFLVELAKRAPVKLRSVRIDGLKELSNIGLVALVKALPRLGHLECFNSKCTSAQALREHNKSLNVKLSAW